jgi:hypothetical protein
MEEGMRYFKVYAIILIVYDASAITVSQNVKRGS